MLTKLMTLAVVALIALAGCGGGDNGGSSSNSTSTQAPAAGGGGGGGADGAKLFASNGCNGCHTLKAAGASGTTGPDLDTQLPKDAKKAGKDLKAFTEESIKDPGAFVAPGYSDGIMPTTFGSSLKPDEITALVDYITGGK